MKKTIATKKRAAETAVRRKHTKKQPTAPTAPPAAATENITKKERVIALLRRDEGATLADLMAATGWQAHSVRGFISGTLRKKLGHDVTSRQRDDARVYAIAP